MHRFSYHSTCCAQCSREIIDYRSNPFVFSVCTVEIGNKWAGVDQHRLQRQFCFLRCLLQASFGFGNSTLPFRWPAFSEIGTSESAWVSRSRTKAEYVLQNILACRVR